MNKQRYCTFIAIVFIIYSILTTVKIMSLKSDILAIKMKLTKCQITNSF